MRVFRFEGFCTRAHSRRDPGWGSWADRPRHATRLARRDLRRQR